MKNAKRVLVPHTMRYSVAGVSLLLMITGGALIGAGIAIASTPLMIAGVIGILIAGVMGLAANT